jgi:hypothetical protein
MRFIKQLKNFEAPIPFGDVVCKPKPKKDDPPMDLATLSRCFVRQETFVESVRFSRAIDKNDQPKTHGIRKHSLKPCGTILGTWKADLRGNVLHHSLVVKSADGRTSGPFDSEVLRQIVRQIDAEKPFLTEGQNDSEAPQSR